MIKKISLYLQIVLALIILAVSINMFLGPHHIAAGGASGIGILVEELTRIDRAVVVMGLNVVMLTLAYIFLGKETFSKILFGSVLFPIILGVIPEVMLTTDRFLSVIIGSIVFAVGVAILYLIQASSGGTTIPPLIFEKYFNLSPSLGLLLTDFLIVCMSLYVFGMDEFLYAILSIGITSIVMTYIETGVKRKKAMMIMSYKHYKDIQNVINKNKSDLLIFDVRKEETRKVNMMMVIISNQDYPKLKQQIDAIDSECFLITYNVAEVHGLGFTYHPIQ